MNLPPSIPSSYPPSSQKLGWRGKEEGEGGRGKEEEGGRRREEGGGRRMGTEHGRTRPRSPSPDSPSLSQPCYCYLRGWRFSMFVWATQCADCIAPWRLLYLFTSISSSVPFFLSHLLFLFLSIFFFLSPFSLFESACLFVFLSVCL